MLTFVGLGLYDERSITVAGHRVLSDVDRAFAEFYTSRLVGTTVEELESYHNVGIEIADRHDVERDPEPILDAAADGHAAFLTAGDPMVSTTHVDLRLRAAERDIETRIVHGTTARTAASSLTGLQNYRFGKATTVPFERSHGSEGVPASVVDTIDENRDRGLHTLVYLDIKPQDEGDSFMTGDHAAALLAEPYPRTLGVVVARAGGPDPVVEAAALETLADRDFGGPLHLLVVPGDLHHIERDALATFGDAPERLL